MWFVLLLSPCLLIALATQGEITLQLGNIPGQVLRIWLIEGARERGIAISRPSVATNLGNNTTCVQTDTSFILWMGRGEATRFCDCYAQSNDTWTLTGSNSGMCTPWNFSMIDMSLVFIADYGEVLFRDGVFTKCWYRDSAIHKHRLCFVVCIRIGVVFWSTTIGDNFTHLCGTGWIIWRHCKWRAACVVWMWVIIVYMCGCGWDSRGSC